ncbi:UPF0725 protein [Senna tora]|uniref:UPF0725 protein n=1 Tax=Senna tora TaxID=362788 RepID=A0A834T0T9_9FABA|nr:UPF0725 protein [Senna tora]
MATITSSNWPECSAEKDKIFDATCEPLLIEDKDKKYCSITCKQSEESKKKKVKVMYDSTDINQEDYRVYLKQIRESQGFDVERFPSLSRMLGLTIPVLSEARKKHLPSCCEEAIKKTNYKLHEVIKATVHGCAGSMYFITFKAIDPSDQSCVIFQAKVWRKVANKGMEVMFCRKRPTQ